jgi:glyoxylase-like metal-dependent hydrolase (beta-lactamase superfamily II)
MGGLVDPKTGQIAYRNARHLIHGREYDFWMNGDPDLSAVHLPEDAKAQAKTNARKMLGALQGHWERVNPGDQVVPGVTIVDAPGHTPGQIGVMFGTGENRMLHVADAVHHHTLSFEHPEWHFAADVLPGVAVQTRRRLMAQCAAERIRMFGAHLPFPAIGHVKAVGEHFDYVIEPWVTA